MCDYSEVYILVSGTVNNINNAAGKTVSFKNCAPFRKCTSPINDEYLEQADDLDIVSPMYNLIEYSDNYEDSTGSLYQFKRDEITTGNDANADIADNNSRSFTYKTNLVGDVVADANTHDIKIVVPLKYLSNFFRSLEMPLINCKISLELKYNKNCVLSIHNGNDGNNLTFTMTDAKLYVPIVTLSSKDTSHLSKLLSEGFKRSVFWNKYHTKTNHTATDNEELRILVDARFQGVNRLFVLHFTAANQNANTAYRDSYRKFYLPRTNITEYNAITDGRNFYDQPINSDERQYDELRKVTLGKGDDYTTGCLLDFAYFKRDYKIIAIDLSKQKELDADPRAIQQIEFKGRVAEASAVVTYLKNQKKQCLNFLKAQQKLF